MKTFQEEEMEVQKIADYVISKFVDASFSSTS